MKLAEEDKLLKIKEDMGAPVKLSDVEKEKFNTTFEELKGWLDDAKNSILGKDRDDAYRYFNLLIAHLQMVDVDYMAGASRATVVVAPSVGSTEKQGQESSTELEAPEHNIESLPVVRPTAEQVDGWLGDMNPQVRSKLTRLLTCFKQYLDPDSTVGIDIICSHCSPAEIAKCIIIADPKIVDSSTVFMEHQLRG